MYMDILVRWSVDETKNKDVRTNQLGWRGNAASRASDLQLKGASQTLLRNNLRQIVHTVVPLSSSSVIWYRYKTGNITADYGRGVHITLGIISLPAQYHMHLCVAKLWDGDNEWGSVLTLPISLDHFRPINVVLIMNIALLYILSRSSCCIFWWWVAPCCSVLCVAPS